MAEDRGGDLVFVVGAPRSGTTWLQVLLEQHPGVATCPETHLFDGYVAPLYERWRWEAENELSGLSVVLDDDDLDDLARAFVQGVRDRLIEGRDARVFVEKTPQHALHAGLAARLFPSARFLHVVRDPRDVVASLLAASDGWGSAWAPAGPAEAAQLWRRHVEGAREAGGPERRREVRFADLKRETAATLAGVYEWIGLEADGDLCDRAAERCTLERLRSEPGTFDSLRPRVKEHSEAFFRQGREGSGRRELTRSELRTVEHVAGEAMRELGFAPEHGGHGSGRPPLRVLAWKALGRGRTAMSRLIRRAEERL